MCHRIIGLIAALAMVTGCSDSSAPPTASRSAADPVTYARHVAPILFEHCASCHYPGGPAPFSVLDYDIVKTHAGVIETAIRNRFMPPWLPAPGAGPFVGERRLTSDQIDIIHRWVKQGTLQGSVTDLPPPPQSVDGWRLGQPDLVVTIPRPYALAAGGSDVWRNFVIPVPLSQTRFVKTIEVRPGSARVVHHAVIALDETRASRQRDDQDAEIGFAGMDMGEAQTPDGNLLTWSPGMLPVPGVDGEAWRLQPGADLVLQLHMVPSGKTESIEPVIGLYFAKTPGNGSPMYLMTLDADDQLDIPAGVRDFTVSDTLNLPVDVEVLAVYPHAHYLGKSLVAEAALPDGSTRSLIRIDRWDFKQQDVYRLAQPLALPRGTAVSMRWGFDNSADNPRQTKHPPARVVAGGRSSDEMAHLQLQVRLRSTDDRLVLQESYYRHFVDRNPGNVKMRYGLADALKNRRRVSEAAEQYRAILAIEPGHVNAHINLGAVMLEQRRVDEAIEHFRAAVRFDPTSAGAHYNLGFALGAQGSLDEAANQFRVALRYQPNFAAAHNNLGKILMSRRQLPEAVRHLTDAVQLMPESAEAHNSLGAGLWLEGKLDEAIGHFQQAIAIQPDHADARENLRQALAAAAGAQSR
jgi:tetratricopeptide (TPR) repeat protein/mono/diheme cytochrome c family protein